MWLFANGRHRRGRWKNRTGWRHGVFVGRAVAIDYSVHLGNWGWGDNPLIVDHPIILFCLFRHSHNFLNNCFYFLQREYTMSMARSADYMVEGVVMITIATIGVVLNIIR